MIKLGHTYKDKITGFQGIATCVANYITGCNQVLIGPPMAPDGTFRESHWFDEQRLDDTGAPAIVIDNSQFNGPDKAAPKNNPQPAR